MGKIKNLFKRNKTDITTMTMLSGGIWLICNACLREGARKTINKFAKEGLKVVNAEGQEVELVLKPLIHID